MILVIDFGSQTAHLIGRRLRQIGVETQYCDPEEVLDTIKATKPKGIIFSGGPTSVYEKGAPTISNKIFDLGIPILGICYGWQLMAKLLGGTVKNTQKEYGPQKLVIQKPVSIFSLPNTTSTVIMSHGDTVVKLPHGFQVAAKTQSVSYAGVIHDEKKLFGIQFHPEASHTEQGMKLLERFIREVCAETFHPLSLDPQKIIKNIQTKVGDHNVICAVSGGVDSTVAAFLIGKAIGKKLIPIYVESGLMRSETERRVKYIFTKLITANLVIVDAKKRFMNALKGMTDPEIKRKTIGKLYIDIFQEQAVKHKDVAFLGQGTIYSDVIESKGSKHASQIKSHHNVGGLPKDMKLQLVEPLRTYYKDEVRKIGQILGLPNDIVNQQPFPGPGYAVRIRGEVTTERLKNVKIADRIVVEEMRKAKLYDRVFQCFAVMTGAMSTAVKGDARVFGEVVAIRAYESEDIMTSRWAHIPYDTLGIMSSRIVNEVPGISRVVYDITTKPPATMEWE